MSTKYDHCIIAGDMNIDFLKTNSPDYRYFQNTIIKPFSFTQLIDSPTRITEKTCTLIEFNNSINSISSSTSAEFR